MVSFEIFVKSMPPSLSELKVTPSFCFAFKIPDDRAVTIIYVIIFLENCADKEDIKVLRRNSMPQFYPSTYIEMKKYCPT